MKISNVRNGVHRFVNRPATRMIGLDIVLAMFFWLPASTLSAQMNTYSNRTEGTRVQNHALDDFTLLAIHRSSVSFSQHSTLSVRYYIPDLQDNHQNSQLPSALFIQAVELEDWHHYFMSAKTPLAAVPNSYNVFTHWPTQDVIDPLNILPSNLGVLAGWKLSGRTVYLPVDVYSSSPTTSSSVTVYLLTGSDLQKVVVTVLDPQGRAVASAGRTMACNTSRDPDCVMFSAGSEFSLALNFSGLPSNFYDVNVDGHLPGTTARTSLPSFLIYFNQ